MAVSLKTSENKAHAFLEASLEVELKNRISLSTVYCFFAASADFAVAANFFEGQLRSSQFALQEGSAHFPSTIGCEACTAG